MLPSFVNFFPDLRSFGADPSACAYCFLIILHFAVLPGIAIFFLFALHSQRLACCRPFIIAQRLSCVINFIFSLCLRFCEYIVFYGCRGGSRERINKSSKDAIHPILPSSFCFLLCALSHFFSWFFCWGFSAFVLVCSLLLSWGCWCFTLFYRRYCFLSIAFIVLFLFRRRRHSRSWRHETVARGDFTYLFLPRYIQQRREQFLRCSCCCFNPFNCCVGFLFLFYL